MMNIDIEKEFIQACNDWDTGNLEKAFNTFKKLAFLDDAGSQLNLGVMYENGEGVKSNPKQALYWYKRCWKTEKLTVSCLNIANFYLKRANKRQATFWLNKAIALDDDEARFELAKIKLQLKRKNYDEIKELLNHVLTSDFVCEDSREEANYILSNF